MKSDLRPDGPPEVLTVMVMNDAENLYLESATFCKLDDDKRPTEVFTSNGGLTEVCPLDDPSAPATEVKDAVPTAWYVRIVFDELLNPSIEDLVPDTDASGDPTGTYTGHIVDTHPVELKCGGVAVDYDGYYSPAGNYQTWPVGPSLVIVPDDPTAIATGTECTVTINDVVKDKSGEQVPADQRGTNGEYKFKIAPLALLSTAPGTVTDPAAAEEVVPESPVTFTFNDVVDPASFTTADIKMFKGVAADCTGGTQVPDASVEIFQALNDDGDVDDPMSIQIADGSAAGAAVDPADPADMGLRLDETEMYRIDLTPTASVSDAAGGMTMLDFGDDGDMPPKPFILCFSTSAAQ
ncbi:MAG TPA: hypothetical protein VGM90_06865 [Kofleriaceae bacterium]